MRNGAAFHRNGDGAAPGYGGAFADGVGNCQRLAHAGAHLSLAVADDHQGVEPQAAPAFHNFGDAPGMHHALAETAAVVLARRPFPVAAPTAAPAAPFAAATARAAVGVTVAAAAGPRPAPAAVASWPSPASGRYHQKTSPPSRAPSASALTRP